MQADFQKIYAEFAEKVGLRAEIVEQYFKENFSTLLLEKISLAQTWSDMISNGANPDIYLDNVWFEIAMKHRTDNSELLSIIDQLRKNYPVGVLTNLTPTRLLVDNKTDLYSHFDYALLSCEEGLKKPDPEFYKLALKKAGVRPEESIFVDDTETCVQAAIDLGMKGISYTFPDNKRFIKNLKKLGIYLLRS